MICDGAAMQISAANVLIASQQAAKQAPQQGTPQFASALAAQSRQDALFAPLDFKQAAQPAQPRPQANPTQTQRPGATLDIRV